MSAARARIVGTRRIRVDPGAVDAIEVDRYGRVVIVLQSGRDLIAVRPGDVPADQRPLGPDAIERTWRQLTVKPS